MKIPEFNTLEKEVKKIREKRGNDYQTIDDLPLTESQKECVLEWFAKHLWHLGLDLKIDDGYCKSYDPLYIEGNTAHSYVHDFGDGGRHHSFENFKQLEEMLYQETLDFLGAYIDEDKLDWGK